MLNQIVPSMMPLSILVEVLFGNIVLWNLPGMHFGFIGIGGVLHAADRCGFASLTFFYEFFHTFRICDRSSRQPLHVTRLSS
jgi:hypothetical protein